MATSLQKVVLNFAFFMAAMPVLAGGPVSWTAKAVPASNGDVVVEITAACESGWHIYALHLEREDGPIPTSIRITPDRQFYVVDSLKAPAPDVAYDPNFAMELGTYSGTVTFTSVLHRQGKAAFKITGEVEYMCCNDKTCLPPSTEPFTVEVQAKEK
ncbi:MAG: hypothetical protein LKM36_00215 [Flavobacteriales bacterium]|jgi:DsbC/DsbD-like thiol-disulfide interchange protein|nr:hypothetical protein [Flavobacteriales bacterium]